MIYTLTYNPSIDYYLHLPTLNKDSINRVKDYEFIAGGKGINVSRMLSILDIESTCVFFAGGFTGKFLVDELQQDKNITVKTIETENPSRINVKIRHDGETDLNASGAPLTEKNINDLLNYFDCLNENDYLCICGSLQSRELAASVIKLALKAKSKGAKVVLDVPNMNSSDIVECQPFMIKPNLEELQEMLKSDLQFPEIIESAKEKIIDGGVECILLSMGKDGSCFITKDECYKIISPRLKPVNTVAAGDSMLAAATGCMFLNKDIETVLKAGAGCGSAAVMADYLPTKEEVEDMMKKVIIERITL